MKSVHTYNWQIQPYVSWKDESSNSIVPTWSRPIDKYSSVSSGTSFKARPIKHWRKQLNPVDYSGRGKSGVGIPNDIPGGSVYVGGTNCAICTGIDGSNSKGLKENIQNQYQKIEPSNSNFKFLNSEGTGTVCVACNPEANIIKRSTTILNKNYYTDSRAYLRSRAKTYQQNLTGNKEHGVEYFTENGEIAWASNNNTSGSQIRSSLNNCSTCATTIYKPNNRQFATQGAVSSSSRLLRLKLNTINKNGSTFSTAFGREAASAGKYNGTPNQPYFIKSKINVCKPHRLPGNHTNCFLTPTGNIGQVTN